MPETELHKAARDGDLNEVTSLIDEEKLNVNEKGAQGRTALHRALGSGHHECAQLLISKGADVNISDTLKRTSLHWASMGPAPGNVQCCEIVFEHGDGEAMMSKATKSGSTPLHSATGTCRADVVRFLVEKSSPMDLKDEDGLTAYELAKREGLSEIATILAPGGGGAKGGGAKSSGGGGGGGGGGDGDGGGAGCCLVQ